MNIQPFAEEPDGRLSAARSAASQRQATPAQTRLSAELGKRLDLASGSGTPLGGFDLERVLGRSDLVDVEYLSRGIAAARPVARLVLPNGAYATGFLIAPQLLLTNWHVFNDAEAAGGAFAEFGYERTASGSIAASESFATDPDSFFLAGDDATDFALVALAARAERGGDLARWGYLRLDARPGKVMEGEYITIIQHPDGRPKQVALRENEVLRKDAERGLLIYRTDTAPGSSGSPCFNDQWQVVALHSRGVPKRDKAGNVVLRSGEAVPEAELRARRDVRDTDILWESNQGLRISALIDRLRAEAAKAPHPLLAALLEDGLRGGPAIVAPPVPAAAAPVAPAADLVTEARRPKPPRPGPVPPKPAPAGYNPDFLPGHRIELPKLTAAALRFGRASTNRQTGGQEFTYTHFSTLHCADRMLAFVAAVNIDGARSIPLERGRDKWLFDDRLPDSEQAGDWLYGDEPGGNFFDRGHLVRRLDPCWGPPPVVQQANDDTFHFTNCSPQHWAFNQGATLWQGLENYILDNTSQDRLLVTVFNGPVFRANDYVHRGVGIPKDYWKVVAAMKPDGSLVASAYTVSQASLVANIDFEVTPVGRFRTFQRPIARVEALTGLDFGEVLRNADVLKGGVAPRGRLTEAGEDWIELGRLGDIQL